MKWKYVKFSRGTAKDNPDMILREYDRIIEEYEKQIEVLYVGFAPLNIQLGDINYSSFEKLHYFVKQKWNCAHLIDPNEEVTIQVSSNEILELYEKVKDKFQKELELKKILGEIYLEREMFRKRYK